MKFFVFCTLFFSAPLLCQKDIVIMFEQGGHKKAAMAIHEALLKLKVPSKSIDLKPIEDSAINKFVLKHPHLLELMMRWLEKLAIPPSLKFFTTDFVGMANSKQDSVYFKQEQPLIAVATSSQAVQKFCYQKKKNKLNMLIMAVVTDYITPQWWLNDTIDLYWVMTEHTRKNLENRGIAQHKIFVGGIPVSSEFSQPYTKHELRKQFGLPENNFTLLVMSGSFGFAQKKLATILTSLNHCTVPIACSVVCGNNAKMKQELEELEYNYPIKFFGFTDQIPKLMACSDVFISKPGGLTVAESLAATLPLIAFDAGLRNEHKNMLYLRKNRALFALKPTGKIEKLIDSIAQHPAKIELKKNSIKKIAQPDAANNLAMFIIEKLTELKNTSQQESRH